MDMIKDKPSMVTENYWIVSPPPMTMSYMYFGIMQIKPLIAWFIKNKNIFEYIQCGKMFPRDIFRDDMITPQDKHDITLHRLDLEIINKFYQLIKKEFTEQGQDIFRSIKIINKFHQLITNQDKDTSMIVEIKKEFDRLTAEYKQKLPHYPIEVIDMRVQAEFGILDQKLKALSYEIFSLQKKLYQLNLQLTDLIGGKWLIYIPRTYIDDVWENLSSNIKSGKLPYIAKASTAKDNPNSTDNNKHVICIYTPNYLFRDDVRQCRVILKNLEFKVKMYYKPNFFTGKGMYIVKGSTINHRYYG